METGLAQLAFDEWQQAGLTLPNLAARAGGGEVMAGEEVTEHTRAIKPPDEILAMRSALHASAAAFVEMEALTRENVPKGGVAEDAIWAEPLNGNIKQVRR